MSLSSGTRGKVCGIFIVMPRTGLSGNEFVLTHHLKKVLRVRKW